MGDHLGNDRVAAAYIRVSTMEQAEYSPESQLKAVRDYAGHHGLTLPEKYVFVDEGLSGRSAQRRPEFQRMIALARTQPRPFGQILLWKYSRFARSREDSVVYKALLRRECGIQVISVSEPVGGDKMSVLIEAVIEAMDEYYSLNLAEEVRRGMREKKARGEPVSAPPLGYRMRQGRFEPNPESAPTVRMIYQWYALGETMAQIAQRLNAMGLRTRRGNEFEARSVSYILHNPAYAGVLNGEVYAHEPLVEPEVLEAVERRLAGLRGRGREMGRGSECTPMRGLVRCSRCGGSLTRSGGGMQCAAYAKGRCEESHSIGEKQLERRVYALLQRDFGEGICRIALSAEKGIREASQRALLEKRLSRARLAYESGVETLEEYAREKGALEEALKLTHKRRTGRPEKEIALGELLNSSQVKGRVKNHVLRAFVDHIDFDRRQNRLTVYYFL